MEQDRREKALAGIEADMAQLSALQKERQDQLRRTDERIAALTRLRDALFALPPALLSEAIAPYVKEKGREAWLEPLMRNGVSTFGDLRALSDEANEPAFFAFLEDCAAEATPAVDPKEALGALLYRLAAGKPILLRNLTLPAFCRANFGVGAVLLPLGKHDKKRNGYHATPLKISGQTYAFLEEWTQASLLRLRTFAGAAGSEYLTDAVIAAWPITASQP